MIFFPFLLHQYLMRSVFETIQFFFCSCFVHFILLCLYVRSYKNENCSEKSKIFFAQWIITMTMCSTVVLVWFHNKSLGLDFDIFGFACKIALSFDSILYCWTWKWLKNVVSARLDDATTKVLNVLFHNWLQIVPCFLWIYTWKSLFQAIIFECDSHKLYPHCMHYLETVGVQFLISWLRCEFFLNIIVRAVDVTNIVADLLFKIKMRRFLNRL